MRHAAALLALLLAAAPAAAQENEHGDHEDRSDHQARAQAGEQNPTAEPKPDGWLLRLDRPDRGSPDDVYFVDMAPGWHVTTGPAVLLHHPDSTASGTYRLEAEMFLFDPGERREGYGIFFGGRDLQADGQQYIYFLLRRDGKFLVKTRHGEETSVVRDWTGHPAIVGWENKPADAGTAHNTMGVQVGATDVAFTVNGAEVARVARSELPPTGGAYGLRVNHSLNLHVTRVQATP